MRFFARLARPLELPRFRPTRPGSTRRDPGRRPPGGSDPVRHHFRSAVLLLAVLGWAPALPAQLTPEHVASLRTVTSVSMHPEGRQVAFTLSVPRTAQEDTVPGLRPVSELWVVGVEGGALRGVVSHPLSATSPAWSPDGSRLAFLHRGQVHAVPAEGGEPEALTDAPGGVLAFRWAPDGAALAFTARVPEEPSAAEARRRGDDVQVSRGAYLPWVFPPQAPRPIRLWVQPVGGGAARVLTPEDLYVRDFAWSPDGTRLALQVTDGGDADSDLLFRRIVTVHADGGGLVPFVRTEGKLGPMAWSPDGRTLAWLGAVAMNDPLAQSLFLAREGEVPRNLTPGYEGTLVSLDWEGPEAVRFVAVESTRTALRRIPVRGGDAELLAGGGREVFQAASFSSDGRHLAVPAHTASHPAEVFVGMLPGGGGGGAGGAGGAAALHRITEHNAFLSDVRLGRQETVSWVAQDGLRLEGVLIHPVDAEAGVRAPLAVLPHGGPEGFDLDGWGTRALYPSQVLAGVGYAVLLPNYRASGGRGVDFARADHRDLGGREFDDVLDGIDHLHELGVADRTRVGISGTSYGGYFSAWAGTRHAERFRLAMPFAGLSNWISFTGTTDIPLEMGLTHWDLLPWEHPLLMWERSPVAHVSPSSTPMVIGHGLVDERVHPEQMIQLHQFLRLQGVPSELVLYPREPHGLLERKHQLDYMERILEAFDRWVRPVEPPGR